MLLPLVLSFCSAAAVLPQEEAGPWYLISEAELRSIEHYREQSEAERLSWRSQAQLLRTQAETSRRTADSLRQTADNLRQTSAALRRESADLNSQLTRAREANRTLEQSFNEYEAARSALLSSKNGEIAELRNTLAAQTLETERRISAGRQRLIIIIALAGAWALYIAFRVCRAFKLF
jgi:ABC-type transporter Mla subunit MlaD